jgi:hypothetical protein
MAQILAIDDKEAAMSIEVMVRGEEAITATVNPACEIRLSIEAILGLPVVGGFLGDHELDIDDTFGENGVQEGAKVTIRLDQTATRTWRFGWSSDLMKSKRGHLVFYEGCRQNRLCVTKVTQTRDCDDNSFPDLHFVGLVGDFLFTTYSL